MEKLKGVRILKPATEILTLEQCREHIRRDDTDDDSKIKLLLSAVVARLDGVDGILGRALITQTWQDEMDAFPVSDRLPLSLCPVQSVISIQYYDIDGNLQTMAASDYAAHNRTNFAHIKLAENASWPETDDRDDAVKVTYVAGYGDAADDVPATIRHAALLLLGEWYELREEVVTETIATRLPDGVMTLLRPYIRPHF